MFFSADANPMLVEANVIAHKEEKKFRNEIRIAKASLKQFEAKACEFEKLTEAVTKMDTALNNSLASLQELQSTYGNVLRSVLRASSSQIFSV